MQVKTTSHCEDGYNNIITKTSVGEAVQKSEPCGWSCKMLQPLWKTVWQFLKELNTELVTM